MRVVFFVCFLAEVMSGSRDGFTGPPFNAFLTSRQVWNRSLAVSVKASLPGMLCPFPAACCLPACLLPRLPAGARDDATSCSAPAQTRSLRSFHSCSHSEHSSNLCQCAKPLTNNTFPGRPRHSRITLRKSIKKKKRSRKTRNSPLAKVLGILDEVSITR